MPKKTRLVDGNGNTIEENDPEMQAMQDARLEKINEQFKKNTEKMAKMDKNGDGTIDQKELDEMRKNRGQRGGDQRGGGDGQDRKKKRDK